MLQVLHEDDDLLVVDKPAGLVCHPSKDGPESSLIGRVRLHLGHDAGRLVNRLDRETSGVVVLAKHREAAGGLGRLFAASGVVKRYVAVVHGALDGDRTIEAPLGKAEGSAVFIKDWVRADGARARTDVRVIGRLAAGSNGPYTLVEVEPRTGRKHQIRIHLASIGHPIVGDKLYGDDEQRYLRFVTGGQTDADRRALVVSEHALHARELAFEWRGRRWTWAAPVPERITQLCGDRILP